MSLNISSKSVLAIFSIVEMFLINNHARTIVLGYSLLGWEKIQSLGSFHDYDLGHGLCNLLIGEPMEGCSDPLFDDTIVAFGFWYMLLWIGKVHVAFKVVKHSILERLEFIVSLNLGNLESTFVVDCYNFLECLLIVTNGLALNALSSLVI
jgi:hypothetical protein